MKIYKCNFILLSELFEDCPKIKIKFYEHDHKDFTWGTNNRSLIDIDTFLNWLNQYSLDEDKENETIRRRLTKSHKLVEYIDLEN